MRFLFLLLAMLFFVFSYGMNAMAESVFTENLFFGSVNTQVGALQRVLNQDQDTRVANSGPGSLGNETNFFGLLTKSAVVRFQEKHASEILAPAGLTLGNGYVGFYTRAKLNAIFLLAQNTEGVNSVATQQVNSLPPRVGVVEFPTSQTRPYAPTAPSISKIEPQNPNLKNIDKFMAALDTVAAKQGLSAEKLYEIKTQVMKEVATTTDLRAAFFKQVGYGSQQAIRNDSYIGKIMLTTGRAFKNIFKPEPAQALTGVPFGGALLVSIYCKQSQTWLLTIEPLPPSFASLLTYVPFSQAFLSYNIPVTSWLLGEYMPGAGVCVMGVCPACMAVPSWGMITPMVGSSPL